MTGPYGMPTGDAAGAITQAIIAANYQQMGVPYGPFLIGATEPTNDYLQGGGFWNSQRGDFPINFYDNESVFSPDAPFSVVAVGYPLGGTAVPQVPPSSVHAPFHKYYLAPAAGVPAAVVPATDMPWVLDDHGSKNPSDVTHHWPTAPKGFHALGTAFWWDNDPKMHRSGACVAVAFLEPGVTIPFWNDSGQGWSHDGNLSQVRLAPTTVPSEQLRFAPGTLISEEAARDGNFDCRAWTLIADAPMLPVPGAGPPPPDITAGWTVTGVAVLPGPTLDPTVSRGAFRYLGAAVSWEVVLNAEWMSTPTLAVELPIGMDPAAVAQLTGAIGAQCGATRGLAILPSANGYVSVDLSAALGIEPVPGAAADSYTTTIEIEGPPLPLTAASPMVAVQQQVIDLMLFDVSGTAIGQPCRFFTPNYVRQLVPAPSGAFPGRLGTLEVPTGAEPPGKPAPAPRRHPAPPWLAALFKWLFRRQQG